MGLFEETIKNIKPIDKELYLKVGNNWDKIAHPLGSLGKLEEISKKVIAISGNENYNPDKRGWCVFSGDNGVVLEGTTLQTQDQTAIITEQMLVGNTAAATMAKFHNIDLFVVDVGLISDVKREGIINKKIAYGTEDFLKKDAMTRDEAIRAIEAGMEMADYLASKGYNILMAGELGIGNTTTSAAVLSALTNLKPEDTVGIGAGVKGKVLEHKIEVVREGISLRKPDKNDPIDVLSKVGGFDIGAMAGFYLSSAKNKIPVILDGFISVVSALLAKRICEYSADYMLPSHCSKEKGARVTLEELGIKPYFEMEMRLGEGTGCPLTLSLIEESLYLYRNMYRFGDSKLEEKYLVDNK